MCIKNEKMQQLRLFDVELLEIFKTHWYHVWQVVWKALSVADEICFFLQFQFPLSTICQCFAWSFANGCDEYLSICVFQHTHSKCCKNHKIPGKVLKLICWCEFLGQNFLELSWRDWQLEGIKGRFLFLKFCLRGFLSLRLLQSFNFNPISILLSFHIPQSSIHPFPIYYSSLKIRSFLLC